MREQTTTQRPSRRRLPRAGRLLKIGLTLAVLVGIGVAGMKYLQGGEILAALARFELRYAPLMLLFAAGALLLKAWRFQLLTQAVVQAPWRVPWKVFLAGQPAAILPGGMAAQVGLLKQAGGDVGRSSAPVLMSTLLDQAVLISGSLLAALWFEPARGPVLIIVALTGVMGLALGWPRSRRVLVRTAERLAHRFHLGHAVRNFTATLPSLTTRPLLTFTFAITLVAFAMKLAVLVMAAWGMGLSLPVGSLFLAFIVPALMGRFVPLPAGVGVIDAGMVGLLAAGAGLDPNRAAALVALFRVVMVFLPVLVGAVVYFLLWRGAHERVTAVPEPAADLP